MFFKTWEVLVVDDDSDVLSVSKLAMRNFEVYGVPLHLHTAHSKAEAIAILRNAPDLAPLVAVAFIDVVMETDTAGLELCQYIREEMRNKTTQLFIRTGQPGVAPERAVIDRYDINGYFTKVEATEDKLYTLVKSGVRQYVWTYFLAGTMAFLEQFIAVSGSRAKLAEVLERTIMGFHTVGDRMAESRVHHGGFLARDHLIAGVGLDEQAALAIRDRLDRQEGTSLSSDGDKCVTEGNNVLLKVAAGPGRAEVAVVITQSSFLPPEFVIAIIHRMLRSFAMIWHGAK